MLISKDRDAQVMELRLKGWRIERFAENLLSAEDHVYHAINGPRTITVASASEEQAWHDLVEFFKQRPQVFT